MRVRDLVRPREAVVPGRVPLLAWVAARTDEDAGGFTVVVAHNLTALRVGLWQRRDWREVARNRRSAHIWRP